MRHFLTYPRMWSYVQFHIVGRFTPFRKVPSPHLRAPGPASPCRPSSSHTTLDSPACSSRIYELSLRAVDEHFPTRALPRSTVATRTAVAPCSARPPHMASASLHRGVARGTFPPDQLASFYKLLDKQVRAAALCRYARTAELSLQASQTAVDLFGDDSLVVADLRYGQIGALTSLAKDASVGETVALYRQA